MRASCRHLTYKHSPFFGCTVQEAVLVFFMLFSTAFVLALIVGIFLGFWFVWFLLFLSILFCGIKPILKLVGKMKEGRQQGYLLMKIKKTTLETLNMNSKRYIQSRGIWSRRRGQ